MGGKGSLSGAKGKKANILSKETQRIYPHRAPSQRKPVRTEERAHPEPDSNPTKKTDIGSKPKEKTA